MIRFTQVSKRFGSHVALHDVDWEVAAGERVAVLGQSGAGKTTLLRLITTEVLPTLGTVQVGDFVSTRASSGRRTRLRRSLGIVFEDLRLLPDRSVFDNVALALQVRGIWDRKRIVEHVRSALDRVAMNGRALAFPNELSAGERQRVAVARALVSEPALLVADEPTRHLGSRPAEQLLETFREAHAGGATLVLATNDEAVARDLGGRVTRLVTGTVVGEPAS